jgi:SNF2 family DNA or RNA helicase
MRSAADIRTYQAQAAGFLYDNPSSALFLGLGLGKTVITLTALARLRREGWRGKALIIAPLRVANGGWPVEVKEWKHTTHLRVRLLTGPTKERLNVLFGRGHSLYDIHVINRELVTWLVSHFVEVKTNNKIRLLKPWPYDTIVIDELTSFGDHNASRFIALKYIRAYVQRLHGLTATPAAEGYMKMFAMTYLLDGGQRFGKHITHFRAAYFDQNVYAHSWKLKPGADRLIEEKVADICLVMKAEDYLPRTEPLVVDRRVVLSTAEMEQYNKLLDHYILELPDGQVIEAETAANLASKLLQLASGAVYDSEKKAHPIHNHKIEELGQIVEEAQGEPIIVCYWFQSSLERLKKAFPKAETIDAKGKAIARWNAGKVKMLLLHPQSAGEGINLQYGGHTMVFFDLPWSLEKYLQTRGRIDRQGQTKPCLFYHLVAAGTDDEFVVSRLKDKKEVQDAFLERIRRLRERMKQRVAA